MQYYSIGVYPKDINIVQTRKNLSTPGAAAKIMQWNPNPTEDVPAKVIT